MLSEAEFRKQTPQLFHSIYGCSCSRQDCISFALGSWTWPQNWMWADIQIQWLANQEILSFCLLCSILVVHLFEKWCGIHQRLSCQPMENRVLGDCLNMQWMLREKDVIWVCVKLLLFRGSLLQCDLDSSNTAAGAKATCDLQNF